MNGLFSLAALRSCYNKRQQTADGVAARQQPGSLFSTEGLSKRPHLQNSSWWILDGLLWSFFIKKKTPKNPNSNYWRWWCKNFVSVMNLNFYATSNVLIQQLFSFFPSLNGFLWQPEGTLAAKMAFISSLLAMKASWQYWWSTRKLMMKLKWKCKCFKLRTGKNTMVTNGIVSIQ